LIHIPKILFIQSRASWQLALLTTLTIVTGTIIPHTWLGKQLDMHHLPPMYYLWLVGTIFTYMPLAALMKKIFVWKYGELL
jgi:Mg2+-importing ATPase